LIATDLGKSKCRDWALTMIQAAEKVLSNKVDEFKEYSV
jgi:hypothetical protein